MPYQGELLAGMYQITEEIGAGGTGVIYKAWHRNLQKYVVVKKIKDNYVGVMNARGEVDILKSLHHSYLPQVYDFLQFGNDVYTVMEFIQGHDLKYYLDQGVRFEEKTLLMWLEQLAEVLSYLHACGILHLDIKPANIMVTEEGNICLIDFNISLSGEGETLTGMSGFYASPEQYQKWRAAFYGEKDREKDLDARSDIYSLGAVLYHAMTGCMPAPLPREMVSLSEFKLPYSGELIRMTERMLYPARWRRYQSADQLLRALRGMQRSREEKRTLRIVFYGMLTGIVLLTVCGGILLYRNGSYVSRETREAIQQEELRLAQLCRSGEYETAYLEGTAFLNTEARDIGRIEGARQSLLEKLTDACIGMESYEQADAYLEELLELEEKPEYYQDRAVVFAYLGDYEKAGAALERAELLGGDKELQTRTQAEIQAAQGDYEGALSLYQSLDQTDTEVRRRIASLALGAAEAKPEYAQMAVSAYESLLADDRASYTDQMNLVTAYGLCAMPEKAISRLQEMKAEYPEQYEIYLSLGILKYNQEMKKPLASRDLTEAGEYAKKAEELYLKTGTRQENARLAELLRLTNQGE